MRLCIYILRDLILNRPGTLDGGFRDVMVGTFCEADFSSEEDLEDFFGLYRNHVLTMMRLIARLGPVPTLTFAGQALAQLHGSWAAAAGVTPAARKHLHLQWEAMSALFDSAMGGGFSQVEATLKATPTAEPAGVLQQCIKATLARFDKSDAVVYKWQLSIFATMVPMVQLLPALATHFLQTIFQAVRFQLGEDDNTGLGQTDGAKVRRVGATMLIKLLSKAGAAMAKVLPAIVTEVQAVLALPATSEIMRTLLIEALIKAGNKLPSGQQQAELLRLLVSPVATNFASAAFAAHLATTHSFAMHGGLSAAPAAAHLQNRQRVTYYVQTMASVVMLTEGRDPATGAVGSVDVPYNGDGGSSKGGDGRVYACHTQTQAVLQNAFQAIKVLHELWVPGCALFVLLFFWGLFFSSSLFFPPQHCYWWQLPYCLFAVLHFVASYPSVWYWILFWPCKFYLKGGCLMFATLFDDAWCMMHGVWWCICTKHQNTIQALQSRKQSRRCLKCGTAKSLACCPKQARHCLEHPGKQRCCWTEASFGCKACGSRSIV